MRRHAPLSAAVAWALLSMPASAAAAPRTHTVVIDKMKFGAIPSGIRKGDVIIWDNRDLVRHSATVDGKFDTDLPPGTKARTKMVAAGTFKLICKYHPGMKAALSVRK